MKYHHVKSWSYLFQAIKSGEKTHDIRDMRDRDYEKNDILVLQEFNQETGSYTGDEVQAVITYITDRNHPCAFSSAVLDRNFGVFSLRVLI